MPTGEWQAETTRARQWSPAGLRALSSGFERSDSMDGMTRCCGVAPHRRGLQVTLLLLGVLLVFGVGVAGATPFGIVTTP